MNKKDIQHQFNRVSVQANHVNRLMKDRKNYASTVILLREIEELRKLIQ